MGAYKLFRLAVGSYDVVLNGVIVASLVMNEAPGQPPTWTAELLVDLPPEERPSPFTAQEHAFSSFEEARAWLGDPVVRGEGPDETSQQFG